MVFYLCYIWNTLTLNFFSLAICQRHHTGFYDFIRREKADIVSDIQAFFYHMLNLKFPNENCKSFCWHWLWYVNLLKSWYAELQSFGANFIMKIHVFLWFFFQIFSIIFKKHSEINVWYHYALTCFSVFFYRCIWCL